MALQLITQERMAQLPMRGFGHGQGNGKAFGLGKEVSVLLSGQIEGRAEDKSIIKGRVYPSRIAILCFLPLNSL